MKFTLLLFLFTLTGLYSQQKNAYIQYYGIVSDDEEMFKGNEFMRNLLANAIAAKMTFGLVINKEGAKFSSEEVLKKNDSHIDPLSFTGYTGTIYSLNNTLFVQSLMPSNNTFVKYPVNKNWKLLIETKVIDGFTCYKATNVETVINKKGTFSFPVTAWYCPKIPYSYGPMGYGNLPGLILEIQIRNVIFGAKKIDLKSTMDFDTTFLKKATLLTEEELAKKLEELDGF
jgi:GLPGLI family protein